MKKIISLLLCASLLLACTVITYGADELPCVDGVYQISTREQLKLFGELVNGMGAYEGQAQPNADAVLLGDIIYNSGVLTSSGSLNPACDAEVWVPIGCRLSETECTPYNGTFDGGGHTVTGIAISADEVTSCGFFGVIGEDGTVKNLTVKASYIETPDMAGGIAGENRGSIINCSSEGNLITATNARLGAGGIVALDEGIVYGCSNSSNVFTTSKTGSSAYAGGISAYSENLLVRCRNSGNVTSNLSSSGGICGNGYGARSCLNSGKVTGLFSTGGIFGILRWSVDDCVSFGTISTDVDNENYGSVGGLVGRADAVVLENNYYRAPGLSGVGSHRGQAFSNFDGVVEKVTKAQLESGYVAYMLGSDFGQLIGKEGTPHLSSALGDDVVYKVSVSCEDGGTVSGNYNGTYSNRTLSAAPTGELIFQGWYTDGGHCISRSPDLILNDLISTVNARFTVAEDCDLDGVVSIKDIMSFDAFLAGYDVEGHFSDINADGVTDEKDVAAIMIKMRQ